MGIFGDERFYFEFILYQEWYFFNIYLNWFLLKMRKNNIFPLSSISYFVCAQVPNTSILWTAIAAIIIKNNKNYNNLSVQQIIKIISHIYLHKSSLNKLI